MNLHEFPVVEQFGHLPVPNGVESVGIDLPIGRLTAYRAIPDVPPRGTVLIVPGYTGSKEDWRTFLPFLRDAGWSVVAISRRGQADSVAPAAREDYTLAAEASDVVRVASLLDDGEPVHLIGHSLGGVIARAAAIAEPAAFRDITMLCSGPRGWPDRKYLERNLVAERGSNRALFDAQNPLWAGRPDEDLPDILRFVRERFDRTSPLSLIGGGEILENPADDTDALEATGLPALVAHGEWDGAWPIPWQADMAVRLNADYRVISNSYHGPHEENPEETLQVLDEFLSAH